MLPTALVKPFGLEIAETHQVCHTRASMWQNFHYDFSHSSGNKYKMKLAECQLSIPLLGYIFLGIRLFSSSAGLKQESSEALQSAKLFCSALYWTYT